MFPTLQFIERSGIIDLGWGHPSPALLPVAALQQAAHETLARAGADALAYGADQGAGPLLAWLAARIARTEARAVAPNEIAITGGASDGLDQVCTLWTRPGDTVLVEAPTYHLAMRILRDHDLRLVPVPMDAQGLRIDALAALIAELRRDDRAPRFLYTIPTFHNPTGISLCSERRAALVTLAAAENILIVEDDVYRELAYDAPAPPSLWRIAAPGTVLRLGSFAKSLAPGLRLGWLTGGAAHVERIVGSGLRDSGGGVNHFAAMIAAAYCNAGQFEANIDHLRSVYRVRRNTMLATLTATMPAGCTWTQPDGGYFVWLTLPPGIDETALLAAAEANGVSFVPGQRFFVDKAPRGTLRLSFSLYPEPDIAAAVQRLAHTLAAQLPGA